jgi:hypothetical protein
MMNNLMLIKYTKMTYKMRTIFNLISPTFSFLSWIHKQNKAIWDLLLTLKHHHNQYLIQLQSTYPKTRM